MSKNGDMYTGGWECGIRHGEGEMVYSDGSVYVIVAVYIFVYMCVYVYVCVYLYMYVILCQLKEAS